MADSLIRPRGYFSFTRRLRRGTGDSEQRRSSGRDRNNIEWLALVRIRISVAERWRGTIAANVFGILLLRQHSLASSIVPQSTVLMIARQEIHFVSFNVKLDTIYIIMRQMS